MTTDIAQNREESIGKEGIAKRKLVPAIIITAVFWMVGVLLWQTSGYIEALLNFAYLGSSVGLGLGLYAALPRKKKPQGRKLAQFLVGGYMLFFMGILISNNVQIEGFFFSLLTGVMGAALMHYLMAKIIGPLLFGRLWCGWACWTAMVLDLLPFSRSPGRVSHRLGHIRYLHFVLSGLFVIFLWFFVGPWIGQDNTTTTLIWLLGGNSLYYITAIGLAYRYRDNRAFCKILCPIPTLLKTTSRFSLIKVRTDSERCTDCGACESACPMDIEIRKYTKMGKRVTSTECILCQTCITSCPENTLSLSVGLDLRHHEFIRTRTA